jgi:hypothetical protein
MEKLRNTADRPAFVDQLKMSQPARPASPTTDHKISGFP